MEYGHYASVSPDGLRIVYSTCEFRTKSLADKYHYYDWGGHETYHYEIATVGVDDVPLVGLTENQHFDHYPAWSPDGILGGVDGGSSVRLTENEHYDHYPVWSPDGERIAFVANPVDSEVLGLRLFTMSPDGSGVFEVSDESAALYPPAWSADGRRIAFVAIELEPPSGWYSNVLYTVRPDGSELTRVNRVGGMSAFRPSWSPDSEALAFASVDGRKVTIYTVKADGTDLREVWKREYHDRFHPPVSQVSWSPDGAELLVVTYGVIWVGHLDGSGWHRLDKGALEFMPVDAAAWSSDGSKIAAHGTYRSQKGDGVRVISMARDLTDVRVLVGTEVVPNPDTEAYLQNIEQLYAWNEPVREADVDLTACSAGVVVPEPEQNPGLVKDCRTLLGLRDELAGRGQLDWDADTPITEWQGIALGGAPLRVHEVSLYDDDLTGRVPPALGDLTELRILILSGDPLTGEIPRELGRLTQLEILSLDSTYLSGTIPPSWASLGTCSR